MKKTYLIVWGLNVYEMRFGEGETPREAAASAYGVSGNEAISRMTFKLVDKHAYQSDLFRSKAQVLCLQKHRELIPLLSNEAKAKQKALQELDVRISALNRSYSKHWNGYERRYRKPLPTGEAPFNLRKQDGLQKTPC